MRHQAQRAGKPKAWGKTRRGGASKSGLRRNGLDSALPTIDIPSALATSSGRVFLGQAGNEVALNLSSTPA
jgi:hypothetical protein